jgi:hypothetical protein
MPESPFLDPPDELTLPISCEHIEWCLEVLGWSHGELARRLDVNPNKVSKWIGGKSHMPNRVAVWLEMLARVMHAMPVPPLWGDDVPADQQDMGETAYRTPPRFRPRQQLGS